MVTARFVVSRVTPLGAGISRTPDPENEGKWIETRVDPWAYEVEMTPDYAQGANEEWKAASPSGVFRITIDPTKTEAMRQLAEGTKLHITMEPYTES